LFKKPENGSDKKGMNISAVALSGMDEVQKKLEHTAERVARSDSPVEDTVDLLSARNQFEANI